MVSRFLTIAVLLCVVGVAQAQEQRITKVATPSDALGWALSDLVTLPEADRPWQRYVWIPPWGYPSWHGTMSFAVNTAANRSSVLQPPVILAQGYLLRWDIREFAGEQFPEVDLKELVATWDNLSLDEPYFHIPEVNKTTGEKIAIVAPHIKKEYAQTMVNMNISPALVYRADWLMVRMLSTEFGGKYYEFRGIKKSKDSKRSDQARFLATFGSFEDLSIQLGGDERVAMFFSGVSGKPRRVDGIRGLAGRASTNQIWITHDMDRNDVRADKHPIYNLVKFKDAAREIIAEGTNGLHVFALFNGKGELQTSAPNTVVTDTDVPTPFEKILQPGISCIRCHGPEEGLRDAPNDISEQLLYKLDVLDDLSNFKEDRRTIVKRLVGQYAGDFTERIRLGRDSYDKAVFRVTGGMTVPEVSSNVSSVYEDHEYKLVDADRAVLELGWAVPDGTGPAFLQKHLKNYAPIVEGVSNADPLVDRLVQGTGTVVRFDFQRVYADMALNLEYKEDEK